ncbi:MAG TPA: FtsX-like permease family protein [Chloroflexia bacterium]|nr:FtsX-like permease family protein [Chloroflexia bacterium]
MKRFAFYLKYAWRSVRRGGQLSIFAIACVAVGVGTLVGLQSLTSSIRDTMLGDIQERAGGDIVAQVNYDSYYQSVLSPQAQQLLDNMKAENRIQDWTGFNKHSVQITGYFNVPPTVYIVDPAHFPLYGQVQVVEPAGANLGKLLSEPDTIVISKSMWKSKGYHLGDEVQVNSLIDFTQVGDRSANLKVVGVVDPVLPGINFDPGLFIGFGITSQQAARGFLNDDEVTPTTFFIKSGAKADNPAIINTLKNFNEEKAKYYPFFSDIKTASETLGESSKNLQPVEDVLLYIGLVAMLVGGIGCINTMLVVVGQRTTEIATIKALGLKSRQTLYIFTIQVLILGAIGSAAGMVIGVGLGYVMKGIVEGLFSRPLHWGLYPGPLITGFLVGTLVSAMFGLLPAYAATRVRPGEVLRQQAGGMPRIGNLPTLLTIVLLTLGLGLLAGVLLGKITLGLELAFATLLSSAALAALMYLVVFLTGKFPFSLGPSFKLAVRSFNRHRTRTTATLLVITVSLFFISLISIISSSIETTLKETFDYNLGFNAGAVNIYSSKDEDLKATFEREVPGIQKIFVSNDVGAYIQGVNGQRLNQKTSIADPLCAPYLYQDYNKDFHLKTSIQVSGRSLAGTESVSPNGPQKVLAGRTFQPADMNKQVMLVTQEEARCYGIKVGDSVTLRLRSNNLRTTSRTSGPLEMQVIGIVSKGTAGTNFEQGFVVPFQLVNEAGADFSIFFMQIEPSQIQAALSQTQGSLYSNFVFDLTDLIRSFTDLLNHILMLPLLLSLLSLFSGSVLIANNVALAVLERRKEVGVLKALGADRRRVLSMLLWESGLLGLLGGVIGVGGSLAVVLLIARLVKQSNQYVGLNVTWSPLSAGLMVALGIGLATAATTLSAWRAIQEKPLVVLRYE